MARRVTLKDVAADVGVSTMTISNAFNRPDQLSLDLRERIMQRARALGYVGPDPLGRGLRRGHAGALGIVSDTPLSYAFADPAASAVFAGVCAVAERERLGLLLVPPGGAGPGAGGIVYSVARDETPLPLTKHAAAPGGAGPVDGVIVYSVARDEPLLELTNQAPAVVIDQPRDTGLPTVGIDDEAAARAASEHLRELGHERIAIAAFGLAPDPRRARPP